MLFQLQIFQPIWQFLYELPSFKTSKRALICHSLDNMYIKSCHFSNFCFIFCMKETEKLSINDCYRHIIMASDLICWYLNFKYIFMREYEKNCVPEKFRQLGALDVLDLWVYTECRLYKEFYSSLGILILKITEKRRKIKGWTYRNCQKI